MRKFFSVGFATIGSLLLIFVVVFTAMERIINDETFINNEFTKIGVSSSMGMTNNDLVRSTMRLIDYMEGDADSIDIDVTVHGETVKMFELDQEVEHMKDVRQIYLQIRQYRDSSILAMLVLFLISTLINFRKAPQMLSQGYLSGSFIALLVFGFLGTWAAMDFTSFWTFFHQMLFWNDLWLFDATESRMINMLPEQMFSDIVGQVFLYAGLIIGGLIALSVICLYVSSDGYKRRRIEARKRKKARAAAAIARKKAREKAKAEAEKAKRIAAKKARRAEMEKQKAKAEAKAARKQARRDAKRPPAPVERPAEYLPGTEPDIADIDDPVSVSLSEGYAADYFTDGQTESAHDGVTTATTSTTTGDGLYPATPSADFFKRYGAAGTVSATAAEEDGTSLSDDDAYDRVSTGTGRTTGRTTTTGRTAGSVSVTGRTAATGRKGKPAPKKTAKKVKPAKKRANVQDDTGFFDED